MTINAPASPPERPRPEASGERRHWNRADTTLASALLIWVIATARTIITTDSHLYLASAKSLFGPGMGHWYHWIREPLYPLQLRLGTALFGSVDLGATIIQAVIVVAAASVFVRVWFSHNAITRKIALVLIVANPIVIGIVGFVGQQAMMLALVCLSAAWIGLVTDSKRLRTALIGWSLGLGACLALASVLLMPLALAIGAFVVVHARMHQDSSSSQDSHRGDRRRATMAAVSLMLSAVVALSMWWGYKAIALQDSDSAYGFSAWVWDYAGAEGPLSIPEKLLAFLALGRDGTIHPRPRPVAWELTVYGGLEEPYANRCGFVTAFDATAPYTAGYLEVTCRPAWASRTNSQLVPVGLAIYRSALIAAFLATLIAMFVSRLRPFALIAFAFLLAYVVGGLGISRYAIPLYPLGVAVLLMAATAASNRLRTLQRQSTSDDRQT